MKLTQNLANKINSGIKIIFKQDIMIADLNGIILSGFNSVGKNIEIAKRACVLKSRTQSKMGTKQLTWVPMLYEGKSVGVFGIEEAKLTSSQDTINLLEGLAETIIYQDLISTELQPTVLIKSNFIKNLLESPYSKDEELYEEADILQLNLRLNTYALLLNIDKFRERLNLESTDFDSGQQKIQLATAIIKFSDEVKTRIEIPNHVFSYLGEDLFCLLIPIIPDNLSQKTILDLIEKQANEIYQKLVPLSTNQALTISTGQYYPELGGLKKSYQEAKLALDIGIKIWGKEKVFPIQRVGMFTALSNVPQERKAELAHQILYPLLNDQQLYKTVQLFLDLGLNLTIAAEKLHIHRNTLIYRLKKIKKLIKLDPRHFEDALQIKLGLMFLR